MGIKGLFQFLKRFEKEVKIQDFVKNKSVAIDIFWFLYKSKGDMFILQSYLIPIINNAKKSYCVFDGKPPQEKEEALKEQVRKRKEILKAIVEIERFLNNPFHKISKTDRNHIISYVNDLRHQIWTPHPDYINYVKEWLTNKGCIIIQSPEEADDTLIELEKNGLVSLLITNDSDLLILGSYNVMRVKTPHIGKLFERKSIQEKIDFTDNQWYDFMTLCKYMLNKDINLAYSIISVYKDLEYGLEKHYLHYKDELINISNQKLIQITPDMDYT